MTDLEMTKLCGIAIGLIVGKYRDMEFNEFVQQFSGYDPLHNDAQAMALVKRFRIDLYHWAEGTLAWVSGTPIPNEYELVKDINRAIVECCANMQKARSTDAVSSAGVSDKELSK